MDLQQGQQALQQSAAAQGGLLSGGAMKDLNNYTQGYASNQYQQSYNDALAQYEQSYNQFENQQSNSYNRLASTAGLGQNAVTQTATSGNAAASNNAQTAMTSAANIGNLTTQGAVASSAGLAGAGNAITNGLNQYANYAAMNRSSYGNNLGQTPPSSSPWSAYNADSTPGNTHDAYGNLVTS